MAAPKATKRKFGPGKTAAIAASRAATKAQTAPGTEYKAERAAKKAAGGGISAGAIWGGGAARKAAAEEKKRKNKERLAKMKALTAEAKRKRQARSAMPTFGAR